MRRAGESRPDRVAQGKAARKVAPLASHAEFAAAERDPVALLLGQAASRIPELVPVRHGRMLASAFAYFRGAALPMARDLATTPASGLRTQLCGDAHLCNFGAFASPERRLIFDLNDFDETLPGPFEWDIKRLVASFAVVGRERGFDRRTRRRIATAAAESYRTAMRAFAAQPLLDVWYAHLDVENTLRSMKSELTAKRRRIVEANVGKARTRNSLQALGKLTTVVDGRRLIISDPPTTTPIEELLGDQTADEMYSFIGGVLDTYRSSLSSDRRRLYERFRLIHLARKAVGVGSVGTRAWIVLMDSGDGDEPLFLQAKEAQTSVLAEFCGQSEHFNQGERVVAGQRLMQAQSDIFLGWTRSVDGDVACDYYIRQLRDWKFSVATEQLRPVDMKIYAQMCGWTLARAHARAGDRVALAAYLGGTDTFDRAVAEFAESYADQNERDYASFGAAVKLGRVEATTGV